VNNELMAEPPSVYFGPSARANIWWAFLPSGDLIHAPAVGDLLSEVERAMASVHPHRPYVLALDIRGSREPGVTAWPPAQGSAVSHQTARRRPVAPGGRQPEHASGPGA
jgi:hypothetical protein